jgi:hypothetical protein
MSNWVDRAIYALRGGAGFLGGGRKLNRMGLLRRPFGFEALEPRIALAAAGLVPVGSQPAGALSGKIVFVSPGHGYQYDSGAWRVGRPETQNMVEDFGNQDQATAFADYLFRAGATVVPMRPIGHQTNEVVLDNDLAAVTYTGSWTNNTTGVAFYDEDYGAVADTVHYRTAATSATETATATYTPNIPADGMYPVYAWAAAGTDRTSQLYEINSSGGQTQVRIDHSMIGNGWVYLGTYHFDAGSSGAVGSVVISNQGTPGKTVVADAIRFGNGMGDVLDGPSGPGAAGGTISGRPREDESSIIWDLRSVGQGVNVTTMFHTNATTFDPNVSAPAILAQYMFQNSNPFGSGVYIAIHSNASGGSGTSRGALGLISNEGAPTPHQASLAESVGSQINNDMEALPAGTLEYPWSMPSTNTLTEELGEINADDFTNSNGVVEMDATLAEVAFHDNVQDAAIMRDPKGRDQIARSLYEGVVEYFVNWGGIARAFTLPSAPNNVRAISGASGQVTVSWAAGPSTPVGVYGSPATGFRVYASSDGYGFDGGTLVSSGDATSATLTGLDPTRPYYFKVVAVNSGGESEASEAVTALPSGGSKQVLIVNGFDRFDRTQDFQYTTQLANGGSNATVDRVYPRYNNSFNYVVQTESAIQAAKPGVHVDSTSNEAVISGTVDLNSYDTVIWILGNESTANHTFDATEQAKATSFINAGGNLFLSGSEIGWDLDQSNNGRPFYETTLKANYVADDANTYAAVAAGGGIFAGMSSLTFSNGATFNSLDSQLYNVAFPDVIAPQAGAVSALTYSGGTGGTAAIQVQGTGGQGSIVMFAFPFETITDAARRQTAMGRVLDFFGVATPSLNADFNGDGFVDAADYVLWRMNAGQSSGALQSQGDANDDGAVDGMDYAIWRGQFGMSPAVGSGNTIANAGAGASAVGTSLDARLSETPAGSVREIATAADQFDMVFDHFGSEGDAQSSVGRNHTSTRGRGSLQAFGIYRAAAEDLLAGQRRGELNLAHSKLASAAVAPADDSEIAPLDGPYAEFVSWQRVGRNVTANHRLSAGKS